MFDKNKRAIVVGASRGIGLGLVRELLNHHWQVIATIRDIDQVSTGLNQLLSEYPDRLELTELDLSYVQTADRLLSKYHEKSIISVKESTTGIVRVVEDFIGENEQQFVDFKGYEITW